MRQFSKEQRMPKKEKNDQLSANTIAATMASAAGGSGRHNKIC